MGVLPWKGVALINFVIRNGNGTRDFLSCRLQSSIQQLPDLNFSGAYLAHTADSCGSSPCILLKSRPLDMPIQRLYNIH
ncbi:hypothetical protein ACFX2F_041175 [Malus domestica]